MTTLTLRPEHEALMGEAIRAGLIMAPIEIVDAGVEAIRQRLREPADDDRFPERVAAAERLRRFGQDHRLSLGGLTVKELVDEGRR